jgi:hypothetical protein
MKKIIEQTKQLKEQIRRTILENIKSIETKYAINLS